MFLKLIGRKRKAFDLAVVELLARMRCDYVTRAVGYLNHREFVADRVFAWKTNSTRFLIGGSVYETYNELCESTLQYRK